MSLNLNALPNQVETPDPESFTAGEIQNELLTYHLNNARVDRFLKDTKLRTHLVYIFSGIIFLWLASVITILFLNDIFICLTDNVLITLLTTSTVNVIGMMLIILRNLFPQPKTEKK